MGEKTRRLKKYLLRGHDKNHLGGIEHVFPGRITGWVFGKATEFKEVRLLVDGYMVARCEVGISRPDVCKKLHRDGDPGFALRIPGGLPDIDLTQKPKLLALSKDGRDNAELNIIGDPDRTSQTLQTLLVSDCLGLEGHCDGIVEGYLRGWAARKKQRSAATIWLQSDTHPPIGITCDKEREGLEELGLPSKCGFAVNIEDLPAEFLESKIWLTFDERGRWVLPGSEKTGVERKGRFSTKTNAKKDSKSPSRIIPVDARDHWDRLNDFKEYLDALEEELVRLEQIKAKSGIMVQRLMGKPLRRQRK